MFSLVAPCQLSFQSKDDDVVKCNHLWGIPWPKACKPWIDAIESPQYGITNIFPSKVNYVDAIKFAHFWTIISWPTKCKTPSNLKINLKHYSSYLTFCRYLQMRQRGLYEALNHLKFPWYITDTLPFGHFQSMAFYRSFCRKLSQTLQLTTLCIHLH